MLIIRRNTLSAGLQHLNWKFNVFVHRKTTFTLLLLLLWWVTWAASYFWWPLLIGPIKNNNWDPLPIPVHSVPIISGPTINGIGKNRCPIERDRCDPMPVFGRVPLPKFFCEGTMQPFSLFLEVCSIGPCPHVWKFSTLGITFLNFKLSCFWLTFSHGIHVDGRQEQGQLLSWQRKMDSCGRGVEEKEESIIILC